MPTVSEYEALQLEVEALTATFSEHIAPSERDRLDSKYDKDVLPLDSDFTLIKSTAEAIITRVHGLSVALGKHVTGTYVNYSNDDNTLEQALKDALDKTIGVFPRNPWGQAWGMEWGVVNSIQWGSEWGTAWVHPYLLTNSDPRLSNAREPLAHAASHAHDGSDPITHATLLGVTTDHPEIDTTLDGLFNRVSILLNRANILSGKLKALMITGAIHNPFVPSFSKSYWGFGWGDPWAETHGQDQWGFQWGKVWGDTDPNTWGERWGLPYNTLEEGLRWPFPWGAAYVEEAPPEPEPDPPAPGDHCD